MLNSKEKTMTTTLSSPQTAATILLSPLKAAVSTQGGTLDVMVRIQAPDLSPEAAQIITPKRLALVVDRSGSMHGEPLTEALACVTYIASRMTPEDQLALVVYDDKVHTLVPLGPMWSAKVVEQAVAEVQSGGSTNLFGGWEQGAKELEGGASGQISRVLLLSDGQVNAGLRRPEAIAQHCSNWLAKGVSTTTVGLGRDFNEELMGAMAIAGGGQQYYGQTAADLYDSFDEEFSLLQALYMRQLDVRFIPADGVIVEPIGLVQKNADGSIRLSDLAWGAESWMVLRLHVSRRVATASRDLLAVTLQAQNLAGEDIAPISEMLSLPVIDALAAQALPEDEVVQRRTLELEFAQTCQKLRILAKKGDFDGLRKTMNLLKRRFGHHPWLAKKLERIDALHGVDPELMSKEVYFASAKMSRRLASKHEVMYSMDETASEHMPAFLRKKDEEGKGRGH
jgi:Ca-activated chloride channel family protein